MKVAMIRVGIDTGSGGMHGPLFAGGAFEYIPIPDGLDWDERTYGNMAGRHGRRLIEYFPPARQARMAGQSVHVDPEFTTFTYGDPSRPKAGLRHLERGDMQKIFGDFDGKLSFQRSPTRWDKPARVLPAAEFMRSL